ncbi:MAG: hypothetical protein GY798_03945 [Hyphomicrobiales bacterium]|nr:hypothetical protein [Hyphomicrobiales bacterium]
MFRVFVGFLMLALASSIASAQNGPITVYTAKKIITMDPDNPVATAVAVRGRRIVSVGSLASLKPWLDAHPHKIDDRFKSKVLMPGLIDPHMHPLLGALQFGMTWITPESWSVLGTEIPAVTTTDRISPATERCD